MSHDLSAKDPKKPPEASKRPQRGRPPKIDPNHILKVAREVFLARGIRATALEVAERAGVSEGAIFYRFKSKEALFREAMQISEDDLPRLLMSAVENLEETELEDSMIRLGQSILDIARVALPLMMMSWSNPASQGPCVRNENAPRFRLFLQKLAEFFERHMEAGHLRRVDSEVLARTFLGSIYHYCMTRVLAAEHNIPFVPEGMFLRGHVDLLLRGALAHPSTDLASCPYSHRLD